MGIQLFHNCRRAICLIGLLCVVGPRPSLCQQLEKTVMVGGAAMFPAKNIIQNAVNSKDHTTLVAAVKAAGLADTLEGNGPFTVFAPTNKAFDKLRRSTEAELLAPENKASLSKILKYHVVPGNLRLADLTDGKKLKTVEGEELTIRVRFAKVMLIDAYGASSTITISDVNQSNGVIQVVDRVLLPRRSDDGQENVDDFFPWPPVVPTSNFHFPKATFFLRDTQRMSLADLSDKINSQLDRRGYSDHFYFAQRSGSGFVVLTRLERFVEQGKSAATDRWSTDVKYSGSFLDTDFYRALLGLKPGRFRFFALVVTRDRRAPSDKVVTPELLKLWTRRGQPTLPRGYERVLFTSEYDVYALVYEFVRNIDDIAVSFVSDSSLSGIEHLVGAGISPGDFK